MTLRRSKPQLLDDDEILKIAEILKEVRVPHRITIQSAEDDSRRTWYSFRLEVVGGGISWVELKTIPEMVDYFRNFHETHKGRKT